MKNLGIYIHIPFCRKRCRYCGFHSNAVPDTDGSRMAMNNYTQWLIAQIMEDSKQYRKEYVVDSVFLGGGTPSLLSPEPSRRSWGSCGKALCSQVTQRSPSRPTRKA